MNFLKKIFTGNPTRKPKIGLVLGSGGARGLTQIGVIKALQKNDIPIDYIAGVSIGSIVGSYYAIHGDVVGLEKGVRDLSKKDILKLIDFMSIKNGLVGGKKAMNFLIGLIGDKQFSDTQVPLKIVATDIGEGKEVRFDKGKLSDAIRASIAIPGIFQPMRIDGKYYLDGGVVNPTPIDVVKSMGADIIIAIDHTMSDYEKIEKPNMINTIKRSFEIIRTEAIKLKMGQLDKNIILISIKSKKLGDIYNFNNKQFIDEGENITNSRMEEIKKTINDWKPSK